MKILRAVFSSPVFHLGVLMAAMVAVLWRSRIIPQDDSFLYQRFIETLAQGRVDLSIAGFQGASFLALPVYLATRSPLAHIFFQIGCAFLIPLAGYGAARVLLRDRFAALLFAYILVLMPFLSFIALRGFTFPSYTLLILLTLFLRGRGSRFAFLPWGFSVITKPFSAALFPFFLLWQPRAKATTGWARGWVQCLLAALIALAYLAAQYVQIGYIIVGSLAERSASNAFLPARLPLNVAHGLQMLFSIHNFYFPDAARTGIGNLVHSSPLLMAFGVVSLLYARRFWKEVPLARATGIAAAAAFILAALLDHMDHFYMETAVILLAFASIPFLLGHALLLPLILATLHFQFFYLYLMWRGTYFPDRSLFLIPLVADVLAFLSWCVLVVPEEVPRWRKSISWAAGAARTGILHLWR